MRRRTILLVNEWHTMRHLISRFLFSEVPDVVVVEASSPEEGLQLARNESFDIIFTAREMRGMDGVTLARRLRSLEKNFDTPLVLITSDKSPEMCAKLQSQGIEHILGMPFGPKEIASLVNRLCNPIGWRTSERIHIPNTKALIHLGAIDLEADVVNLSLGGILLDAPYRDYFSFLPEAERISLIFAKDYEEDTLTLPVRFLRLGILAWDPEGKPLLVRMAWSFLDLSAEARQTLQRLFDRLEEEVRAAFSKVPSP